MIKPMKSAHLALRGLIAFLLLAGVCGFLYWWGYHSYRNVAEWSTPGSHDVLIYNGETYYRTGVIGKKGLTQQKYPLGDLLGEVRDDGTPLLTETESETLPETDDELFEDEILDDETFEEETEEETEPITYDEVPEEVVSLLAGNHGYLVYSVKDQESFLLVLETDGKYYLYYREGTPDPLAPETT